jgi:HlyD family secretion protein
VEEKNNTLTLSGKAVRFTPDAEYLKKIFENMKKSGAMADLPAGAPEGMGGTPVNMTAGQMTQGSPSAGMGLQAMNSDPKTKTIWVKDEKMGLRPNMVKIGIDNGSNVEILSGLKEGDEIIISMNKGEVKRAAAKTNDGPPGPFPF